MSEETSVNHVSQVQHTASATNPHASYRQTLSAVEIERICKAFIRLITAPEREETHDTAAKRQSRSTTNAAPKWQSRHLRQGSIARKNHPSATD